ncbi:TonB-dependent receptor plug domain-containing protein [Peristeroidobacter soli]|uniref:TonB-dependent receptor plug domain-containing protein n=1 Tax=Peristeroidobacter soli TaxID=2497877 RepID=UPI00101B7752|nr:TonB-dependent receptor plug domain-containing protein [Peristeroidobacter soli]
MSRYRFSPRSAALATAVAITLATCNVQAQQNRTEQTSRAQLSFDIPAQPLARALSKFGETTGFQLVYEARLADNKQSRALVGTFEPRQALLEMLVDTGLVARFTDARTAVIQAAGSQRTLGPVRVEGAQTQEGPPRIGEGISTLGGVRGHQEDETVGYRPNVSTVGSGRPIPIEDNARAVSVLTREQMEDQGVNDLGEALNRLPGVAVSGGIYARGQQIQSFQVDGGTPQNINDFLKASGSSGPEMGNTINMAAYERVELVRGVNAAYVGNNSLGGTLNLIRKRPTAESSDSLTLTAGSWNRWQGMYDVTVANIADSNIAFRGVLDLQTSKAFYDKFQRENGTAYGIFDVPLSASSRAEFGMSYSNSKTDSPYLGVYRYADGPLLEVPRSTNFGPKWGYSDYEETEVFSRIKTDFSADWTLNVGVSRTVVDKSVSVIDAIANNTWLSNGQTTGNPTVYSDPMAYDDEIELLSGDIRVAGKFQTWGLTHNLFAQAGYYDSDSSHLSSGWANSYGGTPVPSLDALFVDDFTLVKSARVLDRTSERRVQGSIEDLISWRDKIDLRVALGYMNSDSYRFIHGSRWVNYFPDGGDYVSPTRAEKYQTRPDATPTYAMVFKPWRGWSIAPSYAEGTTDQSFYYGLNGERLGPATYQNKELMVRYTTPQWMASANYYTADNTNVGKWMPGVTTCGPTGMGQCYYESGSDVESSGYEFELSGLLFDQLNVSLSYTFGESTSTSTDEPVFSQSPEETGKLAIAWTPPAWPAVRLTAAYSYRSDVYLAGYLPVLDNNGVQQGWQQYDFVTKGYHLFDLGVRYAYSPSLEFALLAENITDESYLIIADPRIGLYGNPRNVSLQFKWLDPTMRRGGGRASMNGHFPFGDPSRWYTALDFGYRDGSRIEARSPKPAKWDWQLGENFATFWRVGRHVQDRWRIEVEGGYRAIDIDGIHTAGTNEVTICANAWDAPAFPACKPQGGRFDTFSFMANGLYQPWNDRRFMPFLGAGVGVAVAQVEMGGRLPVHDAAGNEVTAGTDTHIVRPALQAIAGVSLRLADRLSADLSYRYFYVPDASWSMASDSAGDTGPIEYGLKRFEADLKDRSLTLALRWNFDAGAR